MFVAKVAVIGSATGKTSFIKSNVLGFYDNNEMSTIGFTPYRLTLSTSKQPFDSTIWDTSSEQPNCINHLNPVAYILFCEDSSLNNNKWFKYIDKSKPIVYVWGAVDIGCRQNLPSYLNQHDPILVSVIDKTNLQQPFLRVAQLLINNSNLKILNEDTSSNILGLPLVKHKKY